MIALFYLIIDYLNKHITIVYVIGGILLFFLIVKLLSSFLRDIDYLRTSLWFYIKTFSKFVFNVLKFLIFKVLLFPFYLIKLLNENSMYNNFIFNNSNRREPEV